jgi:hypothetical protein
MPYSVDLTASAWRHLQAANLLDDADASSARRKRDVAGYVYGIAAECALKQIMRQSGIRTRSDSGRREDPYYAHFPALKTMLRDRLHGRRAGDLRKFAEDDGLMNEWDTDMRYAPGRDITAARVDRWRKHAHTLVSAMADGE